MEIKNIKTKEINQNGYHKNILTRDKIGFIFTAPVNIIPDDCLPCDGYILRIEDYLKLYKVIGKTYNCGTEKENEFRIPDYNITGRFLQPGLNASAQIAAGLPNHHHTVTAFFWNYPGVAEEDRGSPDYGNHLALTTSWASECNPIYGNSTTVQPPSQVVRLCIKYK